MEYLKNQPSGVVYNFGRVCLSVCLSDDNFRKPWRRKFVFAHPIHIQQIRVKFVWSSGQQKGGKSPYLQCETSIGHNSGSIKRRALRFAFSMTVSGTAYRTVWPPSVSRDRKWSLVSKCTHSRVVDFTLEEILFVKNFYFFNTVLKFVSVMPTCQQQVLKYSKSASIRQ